MPHEIKGSAAGLVCVAIARPDIDTAIQAALQAKPHADVIEIRLDSLTAPAIEPFTQALDTPLLFTNRPLWEGGQCRAPEENRHGLLLQAVRGGAAYVDIELNSDQAAVQLLCDAAKKTMQTRVIISWHNFSETPGVAALNDIFVRQRDSGAHIGKIVTMAHDFSDVLRVLQLQEQAHLQGFPLIAFCMGRAGMISRLATLELGGFMTYAALNEEEATAPGQLAAADLFNCLKSFSHAD
ncbi:MAG: type I 3-dehydroquinate dehydratase [Proteobacteria bacterium]|nr:type I 3-dehydroquinate dehydratase [Pseudomonadota bacterium]MBU4296241.1 type I 3-dehydroquinate dehydratase [Pseudomonadota bacterium]MCG2746401.1 type I 3-dehydroquinate dehydratase [Desulfobulbaceae bacterium]